MKETIKKILQGQWTICPHCTAGFNTWGKDEGYKLDKVVGEIVQAVLKAGKEAGLVCKSVSSKVKCECGHIYEPDITTATHGAEGCPRCGSSHALPVFAYEEIEL